MTNLSPKMRLLRATLGTTAMLASVSAAQAQTPADNVVSVCSGVSLPRSVITDTLRPVIIGIVDPVQTSLNPVLNQLGPVLGLPPLSIDATGLLANAAAGGNIRLQAIATNGTLIGPGDICRAQADTIELTTPAGIAIGGNRITGLGNVGQQAFAGDINGLAIGNLARTEASAGAALALGAGAQVGAGAVNSLALGAGAFAASANSVAIGAGSVAGRGVAEFSIGAAGAERLLTNVAAGALNATSTDGVNGSQLFATNQQVTNNTTVINNLTNQITNGGIGPVQYSNAATPTVPNGGVPTNDLTLVGADPATAVGLHNVAAGALTATSTDAVNGSQLFATNQQVTNNTTAITNLDARVTTVDNRVTAIDGRVTTIEGQVTNLDGRVTNNTTAITNLDARVTNNTNAITTVDNRVTNLTNQISNGGTPTNDLTLVGANTAAPVGLHNVADGRIAAGSTDAVNGGQIAQIAASANNAVLYDRDAAGNRTNRVTLAGGNAAAPVTVTNVAAGTVAATSTDAVNGGQLSVVRDTADTALAISRNSVQYDANRGSVTINPGGSAVQVKNVAAGTAPTDAVNVAQLQGGLTNVLNQSYAYTDARFSQINFDLRSARRDAFGGTATALAVAGVPQAYEAGRGMIAVAGGTYAGESAFAIGVSKAFIDGRTVVKFSATRDTRGRTGASGGIGYQF